ncbi:tRNA (adenosine(37)-N6)-dimethylallyltransferase MiaA [Swingsia samuiensis]|uniref:tRNA dimethylallyltransferase n=1 Tax=Swingsia samuiensis TaxID=1293412 RepID=A0A4Y6ULL7_9PROT|nr:tRNA (adenosine(37)-N6)-dimethylallyltransferase MiaA [Swingsia samuiensis]QDH16925.1 tRNA (adenosine(37)-N6)-dimethylallyltransferase MiaA [Swingsia samuiensis]
MNTSNVAVIVAGPTCSGKSALAIDLAKNFNGTVINADSMQVYQDLRILTARPSEEDEREVPHTLYGVLDASIAGSVAWWRQQALTEMQQAWKNNRIPILCGGTGMYLRALTDGLVEVPDPGEDARNEARSFVKMHGSAALYDDLMRVDPETAQRLTQNDSQRISRAWEVWKGTGKGLSWWRSQPGIPAAPCRFLSIQLDPPREELREAIDKRFSHMLAQGAQAEVRKLLERNLPTSLPVMRAHGVPELIAAEEGRISLEEAQKTAVLMSGRYTRRQATWFRHHKLGKGQDAMISLRRYVGFEKELESEHIKIKNFISQRVDAYHISL